MKRVPEGARPTSRSTSTVNTEGLELVMYVEDDDQNWEVAFAHLGKTYRLIRAKSDIETCTLVRKHHAEFTAVLMDIELKGSALDGLELTRLLTRNSPRVDLPLFAHGVPAVSCPIFILTAFGAAHTRETFTACGAHTVFDKPVKFSELNLALTLSHLHRVSSSAVKK